MTPAMPQGSVIGGTLARAFGSMIDFFWPVLLPLLVLLGIAAVVYLIRTFTNVG